MAIDTPARIAVLGAGPIGLEASLYARYLGYDVDLYERGHGADNIERWGHVPMITRFELNRSPLGLAALAAQDSAWKAPDDNAVLTGHEYRRRYLLPLAESDLLVDGIHLRTEVLAIGRDGWLKGTGAGSEERADSDFRLLLRSTDDGGHVHERFATAQAVLDTTGTYGCHNWLGPDGMPAIGETAAAPHIEYGLPDVLVRDRNRYAGRNVLLVGDGESAWTTLVALAELASQAPDTWVTWATRAQIDEAAACQVLSDERLVGCRRLFERARHLAADDSNHITHMPEAAVESIVWHPDLERFTVRLGGSNDSELEFHQVVANVGYRPDSRIYEELQLDACPVSGAPRLGDPGGIATSEPDFYVLGAKSHGRNSRFLIADGLRQIQQVFAVIGDRAELDLYATVGKRA